MFSFCTGGLLTAILLFTETNAHGRLTVPASRNPPPSYENDPVSGYTGNDFVCRNALTNPSTTITPGQQLTMRWDFGALHIGDCSVYISYDYSTADFSAMRFFKIANLYDCKSNSGQDVVIDIPDWLPAGRAVLRWDWYALHVFPTIEYYGQCVDITINAGANSVELSSLTTYSITNPPLYPANGNAGVGFRHPFDGQGETYMTGPPCANGYTGNNCGLTAQGTPGFIDVGDQSQPVQSPTNPPVANPVQSPTSPPVANPVQSPTNPPVSQPVQSPTNPPIGSGNNCQVYEVENGDTLSTIATEYTNAGKAVTWQEICETNKLSDCNNFPAGTALLIPCNGCGHFETVAAVRKVYNLGVEVVNINRCVDDASNLNGNGLVVAGMNKALPADDDDDDDSASEPLDKTMLFLAVISGISLLTLVISVFVCIRTRNLSALKRGSFNGMRQNSLNMPTAPSHEGRKAPGNNWRI